MGSVNIKDSDNKDVQVKEPIILTKKAPKNLSEKEAKNFLRYIYSFGDRRFN